MYSNPPGFKRLVAVTLSSTPIRLRLAIGGAIVYERIAAGGGASRWYYCHNVVELDTIADAFRPGSLVSFYFDDRIKRTTYSPRLLETISEMISKHGEIVFGVLAPDGLRNEAEYPGSIDDLCDTLPSLGPSSQVFYGPIPGQDNDGTEATTVVLPDSDGVVRDHPY
jgi:hypothetical protein